MENYLNDPDEENMIHINSEPHDKVTIISIEGDFFLERIDLVKDVWQKTISDKPKAVAFDCSKIKYIDSSAIGALVKFLNQAKDEGIELIFFDLSESVTMVFTTAKLSSFFKTMTRAAFEAEYLD
jgi:anti-sigma B factor antagonist